MMTWTIYCNPADYPGKYVARCWVVDSTGTVKPGPVIVRDCLFGARRAVMRTTPGATRFKRDATDGSHIVETWV